jgi:sialate O-acetylesterase
VTLTAAQAAQAATLALGQIEEADHTWVNAQPVGTTEVRGAERSYALASGALKAGSNDIVVHVFDGWSGGGIIAPADGQALIFADGTRAPLDQRWLYRRPPPGTEWSLRPPWMAMSGFSTITNGMLAPLTPYTIKAVAWYQGESNVADKAGYDKLLAAWMADWRARFAQPDLPFLIVQLSAFGSPAANVPNGDYWGGQRDLQRRAVLADEHAALVVTHDLGEPTDIHPANKQAVGLRLARAASAEAYGEKISASGPRPVEARRIGDAVTVSFTDVEGALETYSARVAIGFELCDASGVCRFAEGRIVDGLQILIPVESAEAPASVRFCWADAPICNLYDKAGLPPATFEVGISGAAE